MTMRAFEDLTSEEQVATLEPLAHTLVEQYGLAGSSIESINHEFNSTFKVTTPEGMKYALRINVNSNRSLENLRAEIFWIRELSHVEGLKVPHPVANRDGEFISSIWHEMMEKNLWSVLFTWLEGEELAESDDMNGIFAAGAAMARMHIASRDTKLPDGAGLTVISDFFWGQNNLIETSSEIFDGDRAILKEEIARIQELTDRLYATSTPQIIHADLHGWNVMWDGTDVAVFDFDDCAIGLPLQDIAVALSYLDTDEQDAKFLEGYASVQPLPEFTFHDMESLQIQRKIYLLNYLLETVNPEHRAMAPKYCERTLARIAERRG